MSDLTTVHLVRHGEVHNPDKVLYGRMGGFRLSERGQQMAGIVAGFLEGTEADIAGVVSSPLLRAQQTASPIASAYGLEITTDERLIEAGNSFEGTTVGSNPAQLVNPKWWPRLINPVRPSWGEPYVEQAARMSAAVEDARDAFPGREVVLVSHQLPIWVTRLSYEGRRLWGDPRKRQCTLCSITSIVFDADGEFQATYYREPAIHLAKTFSAEGWSAK
jgi:broad specificity phosphatase PhoE